MTGVTPRSSIAISVSTTNERAPLKPQASTFARSSNIARASASENGVAKTARMTANQVQLQLAQLMPVRCEHRTVCQSRC